MIALASDTLAGVAMFGLGTTELVIIAIVVILLFGAKRIPDLGRSVGLGISNFKKGLKKAEEEDDNEDDDDDEKPKSLEGKSVSDVPVLEAKKKTKTKG